MTIIVIRQRLMFINLHLCGINECVQSVANRHRYWYTLLTHQLLKLVSHDNVPILRIKAHSHRARRRASTDVDARLQTSTLATRVA